MEVYPVAGKDCMTLNLSGLTHHFTRNIVILTDSNGEKGVGEVPVVKNNKGTRGCYSSSGRN